jgi:uncharacterized protein
MIRATLGASGVALLLSATAQAQTVKFSVPSDPAAFGPRMSALAGVVLGQYHEPDEGRRLDTVFRLQMVTGRWADAARTLAQLHARLAASPDPQGRATNVQFQILVRAQQISAAEGAALSSTFARAFHELMDHMDDRAAALVVRAFEADRFPVGISLHVPIERNLEAALASVRDKRELTVAEAVGLLRSWQLASAYRAFDRLAPPLLDADDRRRYVIGEQLVPVGEHAGVCALMVRPKGAARLPTLLELSIYADTAFNLSEARRSASNGYVGIEGLTRGKGCSAGAPVPYEHDGADGAALIAWISRQPWSDGRVATFGGSYSGFAQWAVAKYRPPALKAMMDAVDNAPAVDSPITRGVMPRFPYPWTFYTTSNKTLDVATYDDQARWAKLFDTWYRTGAAWRALERIDGSANPCWDRWLQHPTYDAYWQGVAAYGDDFAHIDVPVLTTTGYFEGAGDGAVYYLREHTQRNPRAQHYLLVGPYNHASGNRGTIDVLGDAIDTVDGYRIDPAAHIDLGTLRYQWFDYVLKGGPKPAILQDTINYEVMGANVWRHVASLEAMGPKRLRLYFTARAATQGYALSPEEPAAGPGPTLRVDLADRSDAARVPPSSGAVVDSALDTYESLEFVSEPFTSATEVSGLYRADLDVATNKRDFDLQLAVYELTPEHQYVQLAYDLERASLVSDRTRRTLLQPHVPRRLKFDASLLMSRQFQQGSRLIVLLEALKTPLAQINYGTGKDVSDETIADAGEPLTIELRSGSSIEIPTR